MRVDVSDPESPRAPYEDAATLAISPDGMTIAYIGRSPDDPNTPGPKYVHVVALPAANNFPQGTTP